ncbi:MAG: GNAT family N-acetyltransferase [Acidobacteria bacterium]|nr:MAG: GNAT family N-acetyltransferase [Acidobacteriota bacterium]
MEIVLSRCTIRGFRAADAGSIARHANNRKVWINLRDRFPHPYTLADAKKWIVVATGAVPETHFAIAIGGEAVGGIGLTLKNDIWRRSAEIGYWLREEHWGRGIATEAARAMVDHAFAALSITRLYAGAFEWNPASMRVLEKAGFTREAVLKKAVTKDERTIDLVLYAIVRNKRAGRAEQGDDALPGAR